MGKNRRPQRIEVQSGASDGDYTEIKEGEIKEGDRVITDSSTGKAANVRKRPMRLF